MSYNHDHPAFHRHSQRGRFQSAPSPSAYSDQIITHGRDRFQSYPPMQSYPSDDGNPPDDGFLQDDGYPPEELPLSGAALPKKDKFFDDDADFISIPPESHVQYPNSVHSLSDVGRRGPGGRRPPPSAGFSPFSPYGSPHSNFHGGPSGPPSVLDGRQNSSRLKALNKPPLLLNSNPRFSMASLRKGGLKPSCWGKRVCCGCRLGRSLCICCVLFMLLAIGIVVAVLFLFRMPEINFQSIEAPSPGVQSFVVDGVKFQINFNLKISVKNPNIVGVTLDKILGEATFKGTTPTIGTGNIINFDVPKQSNQLVLFPFAINYDPANDPGSKVLLYVAKSCGLLGGTKGKLDVNYIIKVFYGPLAAFKIIPQFASSTSFDCPLNAGQTLPNLPSGSSITSLVGGGSGSDDGTSSKVKRSDFFSPVQPPRIPSPHVDVDALGEAPLMTQQEWFINALTERGIDIEQEWGI